MRLKFFLSAWLFFSFLFSIPLVDAKGTYKSEEDFLKEVYPSGIPEPKKLLLLSKLRDSVEIILGHPYSGIKIKYWEKDKITAWILEEVGKDELITFGYVVKDQKIQKADVLIFRETRGWEIRYPAFTQQFIGAKLDEKNLTKNIDGVSGATLSVYAMKATARLALFLDDYVLNK
jgi:hypothetical protein